jgi:hypothetical protein
MSLILHRGAKAVTLGELAELPFPKPMGNRHKIRPFYEDVELLHNLLKYFGNRVEEQRYGVLFKEDMPSRFFGFMTVIGDGLSRNDEFSVQIGVRGSYDQSVARKIGIGSQVFVCDNLAMSAEFSFAARQTTNSDERIINGLFTIVRDELPRFADRQLRKFEMMKRTPIHHQNAAFLLTSMVLQDIITPTQMKEAAKEWWNESELNQWTLYNAITSALKSAGEESIWDRSIRVTNFLT